MSSFSICCRYYTEYSRIGQNVAFLNSVDFLTYKSKNRRIPYYAKTSHATYVLSVMCYTYIVVEMPTFRPLVVVMYKVTRIHFLLVSQERVL